MFRILCFLLVSFITLSSTSNAQISSIKTVVSLTGSIIDNSTHDYVTIRYEVVDANGKRVARGRSNSAEKGYYFITGLKPGEKYRIKFFDLAYLRIEYNFDIPYTDKYTEYSKDFLVVPRKKDVSVLFQVPPFELGKTKLRYGIDYHIQHFFSIVKANPRAVFEIVCYPDNNNDLEKNQQITQKRAEVLKEYFVKKGAKPKNIKVSSETQVDPNNPPPVKKRAKGKRYIGSSYLIVKKI